MFPKKSKNALFNNLAAGWKKGQQAEALKEAGVPSAPPASMQPKAPAMAPQMTAPSAAMPSPMGMPHEGMGASAAMHAMLPQLPQMKQSPWLGMK